MKVNSFQCDRENVIKKNWSKKRIGKKIVGLKRIGNIKRTGSMKENWQY